MPGGVGPPEQKRVLVSHQARCLLSNHLLHHLSWFPCSAFAEYSPVQTSAMPSSSHVPSCPSFSSLSHDRIHSEVPPPLTSGSQSSSFVIEFCDR